MTSCEQFGITERGRFQLGHATDLGFMFSGWPQNLPDTSLKDISQAVALNMIHERDPGALPHVVPLILCVSAFGQSKDRPWNWEYELAKT